MAQKYHTLRLILGDQLNINHSWHEQQDDGVCYLMAEMLSETGYVRHHIQKVVGFFLSMRHFAESLQEKGQQVHYLRLDDETNQQSVTGNVKQLVEKLGVQRFEYQLPDEYRLDQELQQLCNDLDIETEAVDSEHFLTKRDEIKEFFKGKKTYLLETFYRSMRKRHNILMEPDDPETPLTGKWNYDQANRKKMPKKHPIPQPLHFTQDVSEIVDMLEQKGVETIGRIDPKAFNWPVTRQEFHKLLEHFTKVQLPLFGTYQDAMTDRDYLLYHSKLSFAMNSKLLHPLEIVNTCVDYWHRHRDDIDISEIEGFVRQIIGWREFMRGVYWAQMPGYAEKNFFGHDTPLPDWYWTGETKMKCLSHAINQSLDHAYAHHIQRLMVTGNFALLLGVDPDELDEWYLGIYMDAIEWVEITNTRGMSQFADGGIVGTKPYVSSANYMHKMGDYCSKCPYDRKAKTGENACPFNSLYWDFYDRHEDKLGNNPRIGMMYRVWNKKSAEDKEAILKQAAVYKEKINEL
jgi:deoxyribodipyrimidine photolyase-related protein